MLKKLFR